MSATVSTDVLVPLAEASTVEPSVTASTLPAPAAEVRPVPAPVPSATELRPAIGSVRQVG